MKERALKVGDFVKIREWDDMKKQYGLTKRNDINCKFTFTVGMQRYCGTTGKIENISSDRCFGLSFRGVMSDYNFSEDMFEKQKKKENQCIVVYRKDREVIALDKVTGKRGIAKCNPSDKFDFYTGAKLAIDRMMAPDEKEYKVGDIFQIKPSIVNIDTTKDTLVTHNMKKSAGELVEVRGITAQGNFTVKENGYIWPERCLNPIKKVKRRAKPGEFVLVTDAAGSACGGDYKNGDIIKITGNTLTGMQRYAEGSRDCRARCLHQKEYVVLEGYEDCDKVKKFDEPLYNGKVVCIDNEYNTSLYTVGKIYQFHDGVIVTDDGSELKGKNKGFRSFEEFKKFTRSKFIEVVE